MITLVPLLLSIVSLADPPNIIVILADDLGYGDVGVYNKESRIPTPHLDALAQDGIRFKDAHSPSAVCTPTRYGLLTGEYAWRTRLKRWVLNGSSRSLIEDDCPTLPRSLQANGYVTSAVGKWHLGLGTSEPTNYLEPFDTGPLSIGFDHFEGIPASLDMEPYVWVIGDSVEAPPTNEITRSEHRRKGGGGFWRKGRIAPHFEMQDVLPKISRTACRMIRSMAEQDQPFFLYVPLTAPHTPWLPDEAHRGRSTVGFYGDFVAMVDTVVGEIVDCLDAVGVGKDTLIIFTSDNGAHWPEADVNTFGHAANFIWRGQKADIHEGGHRVPLIARWSGHIPPGSSSDATVCHTDLYPTVLAAANVPLPTNAAPDGINVLPVMIGSGEPIGHRDAIIHHSGDGMFAIRKGRWKLIEGRGSGGFTQPARVQRKDGDLEVQLYDLVSDPGETQNLAASQSEKVTELLRLLEAIRNREESVQTSQ